MNDTTFSAAVVKAGTKYTTYEGVAKVADADIEVTPVVLAYEVGEMSVYTDASGNTYFVAVEDEA